MIQKHDATRLHYDLRLEFDGVFKSWAVTRGPSLDPHDKRLAVEVEDHPLDYGDFEGTIPEGPVWRRHGACCGIAATWESEDPERGFKKGDLKFTLHGDKLHGSWVLVRMRHDRDGGKRTNWLLIKHRDEYASEARPTTFWTRTSRSPPAARWSRSPKARARRQNRSCWRRAPRPRPTRSGSPTAARSRRAHGQAGAGAALKPRPQDASDERPRRKKVAAMPDFVAPQLCTPVERPPAGDGWCHEIKFDGYRVQLRVEDGKATLKTRKGLDWTDKFAAIAKEAGALPDAMIDGEIVALDHDGAPNFSSLQAAMSDGKTDDLIFFAFDLLFAEGARSSPRCRLASARQRLKELLEARKGKSNQIRYVEHFESDGDAVLQSACKLSSKASSRRSWTRPIVRAAPRAGPRPNAAPAMRS